jgi:hypothetical protein
MPRGASVGVIMLSSLCGKKAHRKLRFADV